MTYGHTFTKTFSQREITTYGLFDPNGYIISKTGKQFKDYLNFLKNDAGICIFIIIIKKY